MSKSKTTASVQASSATPAASATAGGAFCAPVRHDAHTSMGEQDAPPTLEGAAAKVSTPLLGEIAGVLNECASTVDSCRWMAESLFRASATTYNVDPIDVEARVDGVCRVLSQLLDEVSTRLFDLSSHPVFPLPPQKEYSDSGARMASRNWTPSRSEGADADDAGDPADVR